MSIAPERCERCGERLRATSIRWLELDSFSGLYHEPGAFPFGPDCAAAVLAAGGRRHAAVRCPESHTEER